jgi:hypothetical protein
MTKSTHGMRTDLVWTFALLLVGYVLALYYLGYFISTFLFLIVSMSLLGQRRPAVLLAVPVGWLLLSYWVFVRLLYVPLPVGRWIEVYFS